MNRPSGGAVRPRLGGAAISAHRGGGESAPAGTSGAYRTAAATGAEYAEFDIRRTADRQLVVYHDAAAGGGQALADISYARLCELAGQAVPLAADVMRLIAGKAIGHLDLKETGGEDVIIELALEILGPGNFVATTLEDASVAAIKGRFPGCPLRSPWAAISPGCRGRGGWPRAAGSCSRWTGSAPAARTGPRCTTGWRAPECCGDVTAPGSARWSGRSIAIRRLPAGWRTRAWTWS